MNNTNDLTENSIDFYLNAKNKLQDNLNQLNRNQLLDLFNIILETNPDIPYSKNKNGYFVDIKLLPVELINKLEIKSQEFLENKNINDNISSIAQSLNNNTNTFI